MYIVLRNLSSISTGDWSSVQLREDYDDSLFIQTRLTSPPLHNIYVSKGLPLPAISIAYIFQFICVVKICRATCISMNCVLNSFILVILTWSGSQEFRTLTNKQADCTSMDVFISCYILVRCERNKRSKVQYMYMTQYM